MAVERIFQSVHLGATYFRGIKTSYVVEFKASPRSEFQGSGHPVSSACVLQAQHKLLWSTVCK
jgi:hypothetical protein